MTIGVSLGLGLLLGWVFFGALWWTTRRMLGGGAVSLLLVCHVGRFALLAGGLVWAARLGVWPLLAMACGITLARLAMMRGIRSIPA
ncbi:N-ATPase subunit AtpR [Falsiroseomonas selenitidurans]|uniref:ATP synthase subunit I n=1 Tax=Falsiroseomonas selenitidurans TaxID=2716335 RepID=A0ABX1E9S5_9PROT|nr:ATP synthase subunit I [Falsiroseomonas selenitidurans]NKC33606.1 ATP synthase subunit I [Falsiroseomonas selenitidurans]